MGDLRASIKIDMVLWGHKFKQEWWINYFDDGDGNDVRIKEWFADCYAKAYGDYKNYIEKQRADEEELYDREEYKRLKKKYAKIRR